MSLFSSGSLALCPFSGVSSQLNVEHIQAINGHGEASLTIRQCFVAAVLAAGFIGSAPAAAQDFTEPPAFGSVDLTAGFLPDPHVRNLTAGGSIRAQSRFSSCRGYIANAPDYSVQYAAGSSPLIFTVDSDRDTTLVINGPDTRWHCDDDGADSPFNPMVRFDNPQSGRYDVWVGTYSSGSGAPATLFVSEIGEFTRESAGVNRPSASASGLDITRPARFGDAALNGGFLPDPFERSVTAGGAVSVSDALGGQASGVCRGYVTAEPTLELRYNGGSDLFIYTDGTADTTLAINGPDGRWHCSDDEIGTDAGIAFFGGQSGIYDIYVGTYSRGDRQTRLRVSEIDMGHAPRGK